MESLLSVIVFLPLVAGALLMLVPKDQHQVFRWGAFVAMLATFVLSLALLPSFRSIAPMQFVTELPWIPQFGIEYHLGVDGISFFLLLLTNLLGPILVLSAFNSVQERVKEFYILLLVLQTGMLGTFAATVSRRVRPVYGSLRLIRAPGSAAKFAGPPPFWR